jgi:mRNA-degrading endonuclease toxin of MazEF toxin-antitoxin module
VVVIESEESGLPERSVVHCAQIATIQQGGPASRLRPPRNESAVRPIGQLADLKMAQVDKALRFSLALD